MYPTYRPLHNIALQTAHVLLLGPEFGQVKCVPLVLRPPIAADERLCLLGLELEVYQMPTKIGRVRWRQVERHCRVQPGLNSLEQTWCNFPLSVDGLPMIVLRPCRRVTTPRTTFSAEAIRAGQ